MSRKRTRSASPLAAGPVFRSSCISDRSSTFVALYSPSVPVKELQAQPDIKSATHRIAAWRKSSTHRAFGDQRLLHTGHDDDGEKYGGKTLSTLLASMEVEGAIVVARWYGGVMLGPVRFDHIRNCAREAIAAWVEAGDKAAKSKKYREEISRKDELIRILQERDESIIVLRGLLVEKTGSISSSGASTGVAAKVPQYSNLPLPTLEKLEQVRDATIGWILEHIGKAESNEYPKSHKDDNETGPETPPQPVFHGEQEE